jgi:hypothetical protein
MIPNEVLEDQRLSHLDFRVYGVMSGARQGSGAWANIGERLIASRARTDRYEVRKAIARLVEFGWIEIRKPAEPQKPNEPLPRNWYHFTSPIFKEIEKVPEEHPAQEQFLIVCPKCGRICGGLLKNLGWCRRCNRQVEMDKIARKAAREEIAADKAASKADPVSENASATAGGS